MVSIIIPAYNVEKFLADCIESAVRQTYTDIEIIVVNDGSTDETQGVALRKADEDDRIRVISRPNGGPSAARNTGIEAARGDVLMFLDGDDRLDEEAVRILMNLRANSRADIVCGGYVRHYPYKKTRKEKIRIYTPDEAVEDMLYQRDVNSSPCGKLYSRKLFDTIQYREGVIYEDLEMLYRLIQNANAVATTTRIVYFYRKNEVSLLNTFNEARFDVLDITRDIEEWANGKSRRMARAANDRRLSANFNMLGLIYARKAADKYAKKAEQCLQIINDYRLKAIINPRVRMRNKAGALLSYFGPRVLAAVLSLYYR